MRILYVEDSERLSEIITKRLKKEGYYVDACKTISQASSFLTASTYDVVLLDLNLPDGSGIELLKSFRKKDKITPVIILTARSEIPDRILGLDQGADDYLTKPFDYEELMARIRVLVRRKSALVGINTIKVKNLTIDFVKNEVSVEGKTVSLTKKEFAILSYLMINKNQVLSRQQIEDHTTDINFEGDSNVIDVYIRFIRKKIDQENKKSIIETVRGFGYVIKD